MTKRCEINSLPGYAGQCGFAATIYCTMIQSMLALDWPTSLRRCQDMLDRYRQNLAEIALASPKETAPRERKAMPYKATFRFEYWSVDVRYIEEHNLGFPEPVYLISILENYSRAILASKISPTQNQWDYLVRRVGTGTISLLE